ncbi:MULTISPECIES: right-handed parallel beta-helix repeat-containing protein [Salinibaculum]|uniref:right-handed parallel beta-helix repeat-containing protein n=1 Tax=Salinibaculum TaxID=2732368 RepID=UPI0030D00133
MNVSRLLLGGTVLLLVGAGLVAAASPPVEAGDDGATREIDACTTITESGTYELVGDLSLPAGTQTDDELVCIRVRTDGVTLDGSGYAVAGRNGTGTGILIRRSEIETISDVTIENVTVENWGTGVALFGGEEGVHFRAVTARTNADRGIYLQDSTGVEVRDIAATDNRIGMSLRGVGRSTFRGLELRDNADTGLFSTGGVFRNTFDDVRATGNGGSVYFSSGIYLSTDTFDNVFEGVSVRNNTGAGLLFSDSSQNTVRDAVVEDTDGPGVVGDFAGNDSLLNVTVRDNAGPAILRQMGTFSADRVDLGGGITVGFTDEPVSVARVDTEKLATLAGGALASAGVNVTGVAAAVTVTFGGFDSTALDGGVEVRRFDGREWRPVANASVDPRSGTITATVREDGVVAVVQSDDAPAGGDEAGVVRVPDDTIAGHGSAGCRAGERPGG